MYLDMMCKLRFAITKSECLEYRQKPLLRHQKFRRKSSSSFFNPSVITFYILDN